MLQFDMNVCFDIVTTLAAFVLKLQQKNFHGQKSVVWKTY